MSCFPSQPALACFLIIVDQLEAPSFQQPLATLWHPSVQIANHTFATQARQRGQDNFLKVKPSIIIMKCVAKPRSSRTGFWIMTMGSMCSSGLHSHQIPFNRSPLGCGGREIHVIDMQPTDLQRPRDALVLICCKSYKKSNRVHNRQ